MFDFADAIQQNLKKSGTEVVGRIVELLRNNGTDLSNLLFALITHSLSLCLWQSHTLQTRT